MLATAALDDQPIEVGSVLTLRLSHNAGVAFGMGDRLPGWAVIALTAGVTVLIVVAALRGFFPSRAAAGLLVGGAVANLGDRAIGGSVVDFLDLGWWPSFNLADVALSGGCLWLIVTSWRQPPA
jgi:signal peptidase II